MGSILCFLAGKIPDVERVPDFNIRREHITPVIPGRVVHCDCDGHGCTGRLLRKGQVGHTGCNGMER